MKPRPEGISVIIPCHNAGEHLGEAVESVRSQPAQCEVEIIVVDDGSSDRATVRRCAQMRALPDVTVITLPARRGVQTARNTGLAQATFAYAMQLDADDRLAIDAALLAEGTYADRAIALLRDDPGMAFVHTMAHMFGDFSGYTISSYPCTEEQIAAKHHVPISIVCRVEDALASGGYDPAVPKWQDWAFAVALLAERARRGQHRRIGCIPGPFYDYRIHHEPSRISQTDASEPAVTQAVVEHQLDYFQRHFGADQDAETITRALLASKPDRLTDLLHMAAFDLAQALDVARQRRFALTGRCDELGIP